MEQIGRVSRTPRLVFAVGFAVVLTACGLLLANRLVRLASVTPAKPLPAYGAVPAFFLIDQQRETVTEASLRGRVWVADFIFTSCPGQCLLMTDRITSLQRALPDAGLRFVSFSVDPERDTPEALAAYAQRHGGDVRWRLLTGERGVIQRLSQDGFKLTASGGADGIAHSTRLILVDGAGAIRGYYEVADPAAMARLRRDAARLLESGS